MPAQFTIPLVTVIPGQLIASSLWNGEWNNVSNNFIPAGMDSYSDTDGQMQIQTAPFPGSVTSHATSLGGEIERIRFQIAAILGTTYWYDAPAASLATTQASLVPIGGVIDYPSATAPSASYHLADGTAINRTLFPDLFTLIGTTFGVGDGSTTFNLPNYTDKMSIAAGNLYALAATGGSVAGVLSITDPGHNHTQNAHSHTDSGHTHSTPAHQHTLDSVGGTSDAQVNGGYVGNAAGGGISGTDKMVLWNNGGGSGITVLRCQTQNSGAGTSGSGAASISSVTPTNNSNTTGITGTAATLPPYLGMYKMIRVI